MELLGTGGEAAGQSVELRSQNPYAKLLFGSTQFGTPVASAGASGLNPTWASENLFRFEVTPRMILQKDVGNLLQAELWDYIEGSKNKLIGIVHVDVSKVIFRAAKDATQRKHLKS